MRWVGRVERSALEKEWFATQFNSFIDEHIPSLSDANDNEIDDRLSRAFSDPDNADNADLALRTCHCGRQIDGFYDYIDHLKEVIRAATTP